jgi:mannose-6-phosphate isomerase-like protein (cupin superfamily)
LIQKLLVWGCDTTRLLMQPGTSVEPEIVAEDEVLAIASGELKIEVEGHTMNAKPGDCVFIPQGVELALEVAGERPVLKFAAVKHR